MAKITGNDLAAIKKSTAEQQAGWIKVSRSSPRCWPAQVGLTGTRPAN